MLLQVYKPHDFYKCCYRYHYHFDQHELVAMYRLVSHMLLDCGVWYLSAEHHGSVVASITPIFCGEG